MRRFFVIAVVLLLAGCGGGSDSDSGEDDPNPESESDALGDDPTRDGCLAAFRRIIEALDVPDGVDPSDGIDPDERPLAEEAVNAAYATEGVDPQDPNHPCLDLLADMTDAEGDALTEGIAPEALALFGLETATFEETGEAIEN